ncbi:excalibur calcium-binding domain-containing protein [Stackebrandtia albiflava]|uniref:Excalibur calcium-binding domain-containing protein n=1 Tax=Stackebrandtia albiflava TaxID=406432 RepID=A0A562UYI2_9ACTN|nr:excalibur calcium-binding domain-containing protein [Stackebrandtia albiflava]TWJ10672.1 excalibur calcium-binding domain-containing protein [Stackebrandtia albiflava]
MAVRARNRHGIGVVVAALVMSGLGGCAGGDGQTPYPVETSAAPTDPAPGPDESSLSAPPSEDQPDERRPPSPESESPDDPESEETGPTEDGDVYYENCAEVREDDAAPLFPEDPGFRKELDRDDDGVACEPDEESPEPDEESSEPGTESSEPEPDAESSDEE